MPQTPEAAGTGPDAAPCNLMHDAYQTRSLDKDRTISEPAGGNDKGERIMDERAKVMALDIARLLPRWGGRRPAAGRGLLVPDRYRRDRHCA
jgi:hypothetical protein